MKQHRSPLKGTNAAPRVFLSPSSTAPPLSPPDSSLTFFSPPPPLPPPPPPPSLSATPAGLRVEHARLGDGEAAQDDPLLLAHAHAVAALVSAMPHTPFGAPQALTTATLNAASDLAASPSEAQRRAAWVVLTAMMRLDPDWLGSKARLSKLFGLWKGVLAARVEVSPGGAKAANVEKELRCRAHCLQCVTCFLQSLPEAFTTPLLKPIVNTLLPPNSALLAAVKEGANGLQKELGAGFRPAYVLFRARLYELLIILPSSQLTAKLLNVVMPLVVHDLVDPSSTGAPSVRRSCRSSTRTTHGWAPQRTTSALRSRHATR